MVPISHFYLDKEPPNAKSIRDMMNRRPSAAARQSSAGEAQRVTSEGVAVVPTESTHEDAPPPPPASKDSPPISNTEAQAVGIEPEPHPQVEGVEGPITTTIAEPSSELSASSSADKLDEISLGGDGDEEEIDLS